MKFEWSPECQGAFDILKERLITRLILAYLNFSRSFVLDVSGVSAVLSQLNERKEVVVVVAYFSKSLSKSGKNYIGTRKELLAVNLALSTLPYREQV